MAPGLKPYILVANTSALAGDVKATLMFEDGTTVARTFGVGANSRVNISVAAEFPQASGRRPANPGAAAPTITIALMPQCAATLATRERVH